MGIDMKFEHKGVEYFAYTNSDSRDFEISINLIDSHVGRIILSDMDVKRMVCFDYAWEIKDWVIQKAKDKIDELDFHLESLGVDYEDRLIKATNIFINLK